MYWKNWRPVNGRQRLSNPSSLAMLAAIRRALVAREHLSS